jgi:hypothetical protein
LIWQLPNESAWNTNHFANFYYEWKKIQAESDQDRAQNKDVVAAEKKFRILIVGSSIAYFSFNPEDLEKEIQSKVKNRKIQVRFLSYAGKSPMYSYLFRKEILDLQPDLIVYPINFIDFRVHRAQVLQPGSRYEDIDESDLIQDALTEYEAPQAKILFPWQTLRDLFGYLSGSQRAEFFWAGLFSFYGKKSIWEIPFSNYWNHRFGRNTSYHGYAGVQIPERVNALGWTGKEFTFIPVPPQKKGFYLEIVPEILSSGPLEIEFLQGKTSFLVQFDRAGWTKVQLPEEFFDNSQPVRAKCNKVWYPNQAKGFLKDYHRDAFCVRLTQTFGTTTPRTNLQYFREERIEDLRYEGMSEEEYREYFFYRLFSDSEARPGIRYLLDLVDAKKKIRKESFRPKLHFRFLRSFAEEMADRSIPVLIINNPENPISLRWYVKSKWYRDYLKYLESMEEDRKGKIRVLDWKDLLPPQDFSDFHHFTFPAMERMNSRYAEEILRFSAL